MPEMLSVTLTTEDFALLEALCEQPAEPFPGAIQIIRRKLAAASVFFPADIDSDVVTLNSRGRFSANNGLAEERVLVGGDIEERFDRTLPLNSPRGLALIGSTVGQTVTAERRDGWVERLHIVAVPYQPESNRDRPRPYVVARRVLTEAPPTRQPARSIQPTSHAPEDDDPGPSAA